MKILVDLRPMEFDIPDPPDMDDDDYDLEGFIEEFLDEELFMCQPTVISWQRLD